ncbi:MAG: MerR family transcriptional regulator [Massilia sp.]
MNIGTLAKDTGLAQSRIRYYESVGLLGPVQRSANGYRSYDQGTAHLLGIITTAQEAGFSLDEIRNLLPQEHDAAWDMDKMVASLKAKLADVIALQARLARTQSELETLIARVESGEHADCFRNPLQRKR